jgi:hypothetical protein
VALLWFSGSDLESGVALDPINCLFLRLNPGHKPAINTPTLVKERYSRCFPGRLPTHLALLEAFTHWSIPNGGLLAGQQFLGLALSQPRNLILICFLLVGFDGLGSER